MVCRALVCFERADRLRESLGLFYYFFSKEGGPESLLPCVCVCLIGVCKALGPSLLYYSLYGLEITRYGGRRMDRRTGGMVGRLVGRGLRMRPVVVVGFSV